MIKTIVSALVAVAIFLGAAIAENFIIQNSFHNVDERLAVLYDKTIDRTATMDDVVAVRDFWVENKTRLHIAIPHVEIKEVDLWISEAVRLVEQEKFEEAAQKIEFARELCRQIPNTFKIRVENIF